MIHSLLRYKNHLVEFSSTLNIFSFSPRHLSETLSIIKNIQRFQTFQILSEKASKLSETLKVKTF
jgi:hypothetical protein